MPLSMDPTRYDASGSDRMEERMKSSIRTLHSYLSFDGAILPFGCRLQIVWEIEVEDVAVAWIFGAK